MTLSELKTSSDGRRFDALEQSPNALPCEYNRAYHGIIICLRKRTGYSGVILLVLVINTVNNRIPVKAAMLTF